MPIEKKEKCPGGCGKPKIIKQIQICKECHRPLTKTNEQRGKHAKNKGNTYERKISNLLSDWWGEKKSFRRTPMSGAWDKGKAAGDIIVPEKFPFNIECKFQENWELIQLLKSPEKCRIMNFWQQTIEGCSTNKFPMLIFTRSNQPDLVAIRYKDFENICDKYKIQEMNSIALLLCNHYSEMTIFLLNDFLKEIKSEVFKNGR